MNAHLPPCLCPLLGRSTTHHQSTRVLPLHPQACACPQIPHYNLDAATEAVKPVMGPYYREPVRSPSWFPSHLFEPLVRSFRDDHYVASTGDIVYYEKDPNFGKKK
jgi:hypothetical protein